MKNQVSSVASGRAIATRKPRPSGASWGSVRTTVSTADHCVHTVGPSPAGKTARAATTRIAVPAALTRQRNSKRSSDAFRGIDFYPAAVGTLNPYARFGVLSRKRINAPAVVELHVHRDNSE